MHLNQMFYKSHILHDGNEKVTVVKTNRDQ